VSDYFVFTASVRERVAHDSVSVNARKLWHASTRREYLLWVLASAITLMVVLTTITRDIYSQAEVYMHLATHNHTDTITSEIHMSTHIHNEVLTCSFG